MVATRNERNDTEQIRVVNRKSILNYLRVNGPVARVDIGRALKLSPATITQIISELKVVGRIKEVAGNHDNEVVRGRPRVLINLAPDAKYVLAIRLSINQLRISLGDYQGKVVAEVSNELQTRLLTSEELLAILLDSVESFINRLPRENLPEAICVAVQGVVNSVAGSVLWSPALREKNVQLRRLIEDKIQLSTTMINDADCLAIGVRQLPAYQNLRDVVVVMLGYGVGMGYFIDGILYQGARGGAGELGHLNYIPNGAPCLCGRRGCVEAYLGDYALFRDAKYLLPFVTDDELHPTEDSMRAIVEMADAGDPDLIGLFNRAGVALGYALASVIGILSPVKIILSGPGVRAYRHLELGIKEGMASALVSVLSEDTVLEVVNIDDNEMINGAISLALQSLD